MLLEYFQNVIIDKEWMLRWKLISSPFTCVQYYSPAKKITDSLRCIYFCSILFTVRNFCHRLKGTAGRQSCSNTTAFQYQTGSINQVVCFMITDSKQSCHSFRSCTNKDLQDKSFSVSYHQMSGGTRDDFLCCYPAICAWGLTEHFHFTRHFHPGPNCRLSRSLALP